MSYLKVFTYVFNSPSLLGGCEFGLHHLPFLTQRNKDLIMVVVVDQFSKMAHSIPCHTIFDATQVTNPYFEEIVRFHGIIKSMVSDGNSKLVIHFWLTLWKRIGIHLK